MVDMAIVYGQVGWFTDIKPEYPNVYLEGVVKRFVQCAADSSLRQTTKQNLECREPVAYHHVGRRRSQSTSGMRPEVRTEDRARRSSAVPDGFVRGNTLKVPGM